MNNEELAQRWREIDRELEELAEGKVNDGDSIDRESALLLELDQLERESGEVWFRERDLELRSCQIIGTDGVVITTEDGWRDHAPPQEDYHWEEYRSAMESCRAWLREGPAVPEELYAALKTRPETRLFGFGDVYPEFVARLDDFGGQHRNADIHAVARRGTTKMVLNVEAKADEKFGTVIGPYYDRTVKFNNDPETTRRSNVPTRIETLVQGVFGRPLDEKIKKLRYQLLFGLAAPVIYAHHAGVGLAVLVVHEFVSHTTTQANLSRNATDLKNFIEQVPGWQSVTFEEGKLLPPIRLPGWDVLVTLGKVRTALRAP